MFPAKPSAEHGDEVCALPRPRDLEEGKSHPLIDNNDTYVAGEGKMHDLEGQRRRDWALHWKT
jgi:hypothetical protein